LEKLNRERENGISIFCDTIFYQGFGKCNASWSIAQHKKHIADLVFCLILFM